MQLRYVLCVSKPRFLTRMHFPEKRNGDRIRIRLLGPFKRLCDQVQHPYMHGWFRGRVEKVIIRAAPIVVLPFELMAAYVHITSLYETVYVQGRGLAGYNLKIEFSSDVCLLRS
jgi:hypothetical protein